MSRRVRDQAPTPLETDSSRLHNRPHLVLKGDKQTPSPLTALRNFDFDCIEMANTVAVNLILAFTKELSRVFSESFDAVELKFNTPTVWLLGTVLEIELIVPGYEWSDIINIFSE